ncbi:hypothetical protein FRC00_001125 [Tulasnella sp. 408]|nr:hypothetical protein FRC00_001125 [Tulasnella sp. 408]
MDIGIHVEEEHAQIDNGPALAENLHRMGNILFRQDKYAEAEYYLLAQAIYLSLSDARGELTELEKLGVSYLSLKRYAEAEGCFAQARLLCASIVDDECEAKA